MLLTNYHVSCGLCNLVNLMLTCIYLDVCLWVCKSYSKNVLKDKPSIKMYICFKTQLHNNLWRVMISLDKMIAGSANLETNIG